MIKPTDSNYDFVELNRTFHELTEDALENDDADDFRYFHLGKPLGWSDLIAERRVVLLSEAGSGKTQEISNIAKGLRNEGKAAFFLRLEHIADDFEGSFEEGSSVEFQEWIEGDSEGWLLLDSIDEARLRNPMDFHGAIRKIGKRVYTATDRLHVVITGRTTAWRPSTDLAYCRQHLPYKPPSKSVADSDAAIEGNPDGSVSTKDQDRSGKSHFKLVALDDLSEDQIGFFANSRGVTDTTNFLNAVERADAWSFTARPQDLEELIEFWRNEKRIGSRLELMQNSIKRRLSERHQDRADFHPLSLQDARHGAKLLAAAATFGREPIIQVPDGADGAIGISVSDVLPDWDDKKQSILLSRPIFDEAIYGSVRFHHRSVREYLTAEWLADLLSKETSRRKIEALLFQKQYGLEVVVPTLRPVLPWLAILDEKIRERLRQIAPEVVFEGGDPSRLPLETRRAILAEVCEQMASEMHGRSLTTHEAVQRFADVDLSDDITSLLKKYCDNDDLTGFLLRMVWLGEVKDALPEAKRVAMSPSVSKYTRIAAFRAVRAIGSEIDREEIRRAFLKEGKKLKRQWLAELIEEINPSTETNNWLLACLEKCAAKKEFSVDHLSDAISKYIQAADIDLLPELIVGMNKLLNKPPVVERHYCEISGRFSWLLMPAGEAVERLVLKRHDTACERDALAILLKCAASRGYDTYDTRNACREFSKLIPEWRELNRTLFWYEVEQVRVSLDKAGDKRLDDFWPVYVLREFWHFGEDDFDYVADQINRQPLGDNKLIALSLAFQIYKDHGRPRRWREHLKKLVSGNDELTARLGTYLKPRGQDVTTRRWKQQDARWKKRSEAENRKRQKKHHDWKKYLLKNPEALRNPNLPTPNAISTAQYYLNEKLRDKQDNSLSRWTNGDWQLLIDEYGEEVARAFRDGSVNYWRRNRPKLRSEGAPLNQTSFADIFGLTGISIEARETSNWPVVLDENEIDLVCRYASHELNGFPTWFPKLFERNPNQISEFLLTEIYYQLSIDKPDNATDYLLGDVSWSGEWAWNTLAPKLLKYLVENEPVNLNNLHKLLKIVQGSSVANDEIGALAAKKCRGLRDLEHLAFWYAVWTGIDPNKAISAFSTRIAKVSQSNDQTVFAMNYMTNLCGERRNEPSYVRSAFRTPQHLKVLYLLAHKHVRLEDDLNRAGTGVYSPGIRDRAQEARNSLYSSLTEISGKEAFLALREVSEEHPDVHSRSWMAHQAKMKAEQDADIVPWSPSQVRDFNDQLECTPTNHRELYELAVMRLLDLKDDIENGDSSIAQILISVTQETDMRKYIGRELREKAFNRYSIPQEEELADAKRMDLRFHGVGFDGPVPVELKLAEKWTGPKLFERLENQLCGDYLRDIRSRKGLFVLVSRGKKGSWEIPSSVKSVDFKGLVEGLQSHWEQISPKFAGVDDVLVVGIDLTARTSN